MKKLGFGTLAASLLAATTSPADAAVFVHTNGQIAVQGTQSILDDLINQALARLQGNSDDFDNLLNNITDSMKDKQADLDKTKIREDQNTAYTSRVNNKYVTITTYGDGGSFARAASDSEIQQFLQVTGESELVAAAPEPATWAMMLMGFGMVAGAARYRRRATHLSFAGGETARA